MNSTLPRSQIPKRTELTPQTPRAFNLTIRRNSQIQQGQRTETTMSYSGFSTEALRHQLRLQQARPVANLRSRLVSTSKSDRTDRVSSKESDENSLFAHEQCSIRRRQSSSCEMLGSEDELKPSRGPSTATECKEGKFRSSKLFSETRTAAFPGKLDHRVAERLAIDEEDDLLMLMEGQWTAASPGARGCPIDLDRYTRISDRSRTALRSSFSVRQSSKVSPRPTTLRKNEAFDSKIARQMEKEETQTRARRLREAALRTRDCAVCGDATLIIELPWLVSCAHDADVCADCYTAWLASQLVDNGWQEVKCPGPSCRVRLTYDEIKAYASKDTFERYDTVQARNALSADPSFRWCRAEGCTSGQIHDIEELGNVFDCVECHERFCIVHGCAYHDNETCEEYEYRTSGQKDRDERKREDEASEEAVKNLAKKCPNEGCGSSIQKNGGCNHMKCWKCRHDFCYVCLRSDWTRCGHLHANA